MRDVTRVFDVLVWDERGGGRLQEWPTFQMRRWYGSGEPPLYELLGDGWVVASCVPVRHGFLWLKDSKVWTFFKPVGVENFTMPGSGTYGQRLTPAVPDFPHEEGL